MHVSIAPLYARHLHKYRPPIQDRLRTEPNDEVPKLKPALRARALAPAKSDSTVNGPTDMLRSFNQRKGETKAKKVLVWVNSNGTIAVVFTSLMGRDRRVVRICSR
jgi:hypothetical protein